MSEYVVMHLVENKSNFDADAVLALVERVFHFRVEEAKKSRESDYSRVSDYVFGNSYPVHVFVTLAAARQVKYGTKNLSVLEEDALVHAVKANSWAFLSLGLPDVIKSMSPSELIAGEVEVASDASKDVKLTCAMMDVAKNIARLSYRNSIRGRLYYSALTGFSDRHEKELDSIATNNQTFIVYKKKRKFGSKKDPEHFQAVIVEKNGKVLTEVEAAKKKLKMTNIALGKKVGDLVSDWKQSFVDKGRTPTPEEQSEIEKQERFCTEVNFIIERMTALKELLK